MYKFKGLEGFFWGGGGICNYNMAIFICVCGCDGRSTFLDNALPNACIYQITLLQSAVINDLQ